MSYLPGSCHGIETLHDRGLGDSGTLSTVELSAGALMLASIAAAVSYVVVERPAMRLR
jgi:hypothetical protein